MSTLFLLLVLLAKWRQWQHGTIFWAPASVLFQPTPHSVVLTSAPVLIYCQDQCSPRPDDESCPILCSRLLLPLHFFSQKWNSSILVLCFFASVSTFYPGNNDVAFFPLTPKPFLCSRLAKAVLCFFVLISRRTLLNSLSMPQPLIFTKRCNS